MYNSLSWMPESFRASCIMLLSNHGEFITSDHHFRDDCLRSRSQPMEMRSVTRRCFASWDEPRRGVLRCCCCFRLHIGLIKLLPITIIPPKNFICFLLLLLSTPLLQLPTIHVRVSDLSGPQLPPPIQPAALSTKTQPSSLLHSDGQRDRSSSVCT